MPHISLVIPAFNEEDFLPALLDTVDRARTAYSGDPDTIEVVVADNDSTDRTAEIARARGCRVARVEKRRIAAARNAGARLAEGDIVAFVDADSLIHPDTFNAIDRTLQDDVIIGATGITMSRWSLGIGISIVLVYPIIYALGADSGVVFCRRPDWEEVGGYNEEMTCAEDVDFFFRIKKLGRSRGQRFRRTGSARTVTSARKFDKHGDWHYVKAMALAPLWGVTNRKALRDFAQMYWYDDRA